MADGTIVTFYKLWKQSAFIGQLGCQIKEVLMFKYLNAFPTYVKTKLCKPANTKVVLVKFGLEIKLLIIFWFLFTGLQATDGLGSCR